MYKNKLQEICQKKKYPLPIYHTTQKKHHTKQPPIFVSTVTITYDTKTLSAIGEQKSNKKKAESSAAYNMLSILNRLNKKITKHYISNTPIDILIDMENVYMGDFFEQKQFSNDFRFIGFATENHSSIKVSPSRIDEIKTIKSHFKDACDILMIGYVAISSHNNNNSHIIIVTQDHFGHGLVDYINQTCPDVDIVLIKNTLELEKYFNNSERGFLH